MGTFLELDLVQVLVHFRAKKTLLSGVFVALAGSSQSEP